MAQLKDLLVSGASRFLNVIHGSIDGNAATSDKVNHKLIIKVGASDTGTNYDGSASDAEDKNTTVIITPSSLGLGQSVKWVGAISDTLSFGVDKKDDLYYILCDTNLANQPTIMPINTSISHDASRLLSIDATGSDEKIYVANTYFQPQIGDIVRYGDNELLCINNEEMIQVGTDPTKKKSSHWIIFGNNEVWHTY